MQTLPLPRPCSIPVGPSCSLQFKVNEHSCLLPLPVQMVCVLQIGSQDLSLTKSSSRVWGVEPDLGEGLILGTSEFRMGTPEGQLAGLQDTA